MADLYRYNLPRFTERKFAPYALAMGQANLAWNELHEHLARLFALTIENVDRAQGLALWQVLGSDRAKRDLLKVSVKTMPSLAKWASLNEDVIWLVNRVEALEDTRNNIIHGPLQLVGYDQGFWKGISARAMKSHGVVMPAVWGGNVRASKMAGKDVLSEYRYCRDQALTLRDFTAAIDDSLCDNLPWPKRPRKLVRKGSTKA